MKIWKKGQATDYHKNLSLKKTGRQAKQQNNVEIHLVENHTLKNGEQVCGRKTLKPCVFGYAQPSQCHTKEYKLMARLTSKISTTNIRPQMIGPVCYCAITTVLNNQLSYTNWRGNNNESKFEVN